MKISNSVVCLDLEIVVYGSKEQFFLHGFEKGLVFKFFFCKVTKLCTACSWYALLVDCCILLLLLKLLNLIIFTWCQVQLCIMRKTAYCCKKSLEVTIFCIGMCIPQPLLNLISIFSFSETITDVHLYLICIYHERRCSSAWRNCIIRRKQISHNISFASIYIADVRP